jgi:preprotein translocase subunit SecE
MLQRQGQLEPDGSPSTRRAAPTQPGRRPQAPAVRPSILSRILEFLREVRSEWRQVAWPTRSEIMNSSLVVFVVLVALVCFIFGLNWLFSHGFIDLFNS